MAKGICVKKKYTVSLKKNATIKGNENSKGYWSGDLADQVIVYVFEIYFFLFQLVA